MNKLLYIFLLTLLFSCNKNKKESYLNGFDVSPDIRNIVFSYKTDSLNCIYLRDITSNISHIILKSKGNYINPKYSNNGKIIISLYYPTNNLEPEFHLYDIVAKKLVKKIKVNRGFISDYSISSDNKIYYLQAQTFDSYSPIAPKAFHNYDIYELDLDSCAFKRLSSLKAYYMGEIINYGKDSLIISIQGETPESGLFSITKNINDSFTFSKIVIKNDTLRNSTMYRNPTILSNGNILCASSYQMVQLDLKNKLEYPVLSSMGFHYTIIRSIGDLIFYQQKDDTNNIYYFHLKNKKIKSINLQVSNYNQ